MATNLDIITGALRNLGELASGETPTADEAAAFLAVYNDMVAAFDAMNIHTGFSSQALTDTVFFDEKHHDALKCMLAVNIAPMLGATPSPLIVSRALKGKQLISADFMATPDVSHSDGLVPMPSQRIFW